MPTERPLRTHSYHFNRFNRGARAFKGKILKPLIIAGLLLSFLGQGTAFARGLVPNILHFQTADLRTRVIIQIFIKTQNIRSLEDYARWLFLNIQYRKDTGEDRWARPEETLRRGFGDCEDLTFLNQAVLKALGIQAHAVAFSRPGYGHAFCAFKMNGAFAVFDNTQLILTQADSFEEIVEYVGQKEHPKYFLELSLRREEVKFFYFKGWEG